MNIAIINYNSGNLKNLADAIKYVGFNPKIISETSNCNDFDAVILPGVGAFRSSMSYLKSKNFDKFIIEFIETGKNVLGICLGFQMFFEKSFEDGNHNGLGLIKGEVIPFSKNNNLKTDQLNTHLGWNNLSFNEDDHVSSNLFNNNKYYFLHSCFARSETHYPISASTVHNEIKFLSFIKKDNLIGVQFHPEKSRENGVNLLRNLLVN